MPTNPDFGVTAAHLPPSSDTSDDIWQLNGYHPTAGDMEQARKKTVASKAEEKMSQNNNNNVVNTPPTSPDTTISSSDCRLYAAGDDVRMGYTKGECTTTPRVSVRPHQG